MCGKESKKLFDRTRHPVDGRKQRSKAARFQDFVKYADFFYRTMGIRPYENAKRHSKGQSVLASLLFYFEIVNMNVNMSSQVVFVVVALMSGEHFIEATYVLSYIGFDMVSNCKILYVWLQKSTLRKLVNEMKCIFPERLPLQRDYNLEKYLKQCSLITLSFSWLYMILIWTYNLMAIVKYIVGNRLMGWQDIEQEMPFITYIPWDWQNHWSFYALYASQSLAGYTSAAGQISSDLLLIACVTQLIMHFDYLSRKIMNFPCGQGRRKDMEFVKAVAVYHDNLLE